MGIFDLFKKKKKDEAITTVSTKPEIPTNENVHAIKLEEKVQETPKEAVKNYEVYEFRVAGAFNNQPAIKKAIKLDKEEHYGFDEQYQGMKNKDIIEDTYDERIYQYDEESFHEVELKPEPDNEFDNEAIAVHVNGYKVGYVLKKNFITKKRIILEALNENKKLEVDATLYGGKFKVNSGDEIETDTTEYGINVEVIIYS
ncbi:hypothetical protein [Jeotgalibacillus malaysiensis]|uniref:hypothetical protein n=1 Tax=Jeotgalibacillus malaysiensis TaxID=1508404 RepID=UPI00385121BB